jgi:hypothetical protein
VADRRSPVPLTMTQQEREALDRNRGELSRQAYLRRVATGGRKPQLPVPAVDRAEWVRLYTWQRRLEEMWLGLQGHMRGADGDPGTAMAEVADLLIAVHEETIRLRKELLERHR